MTINGTSKLRICINVSDGAQWAIITPINATERRISIETFRFLINNVKRLNLILNINYKYPRRPILSDEQTAQNLHQYKAEPHYMPGNSLALTTDEELYLHYNLQQPYI